MIEHERSFVFTWDSAREFIKNNEISVDFDHVNEHIEDYYFDKGCRIRQCVKDGNTQYHITCKKGDKSRGYREENEAELGAEAAAMMIPKATLVVKKNRYTVKSSDEYDVTLDMIEQPMELAVLEVEARSQIVYPIPADILERLFNISGIKECPLSAYSLFKRKIGICGGPSSGKSETAKILSHILNTKFNANSFHVAEFATTFIQKYNRNPQFLDQFFVWYGQHEREENAGKSNVVISDCPTFLAYVYMLLLQKFDFCSESAMYLSKIYKRVLFDLLSYTDIVFMQLQNYEQNNIRYQTEEEALDIEYRIRRFLEDHKVPHSKATYNDIEDIVLNLFYIN